MRPARHPDPLQRSLACPLCDPIVVIRTQLTRNGILYDVCRIHGEFEVMVRKGNPETVGWRPPLKEYTRVTVTTVTP